MLKYIYDFWNTESSPAAISSNSFHTTDDDKVGFSIIDKKYLISKDDLIKVNLKPVTDIIPGPSRNMPLMDKINLRMLNKAQLDVILNVKLRKTEPKVKQKIYEPRHPVLKELKSRVQIKY
jgi:hypothetical protein